MDAFPAALITARRLTEAETGSARPHAPVQPAPAARPPRARRSRNLVATTLQRAADRVAPAGEYATQR